MERNYQYDLSGKHLSMFDQQSRIKKAQKTISVLKNFLTETSNLNLLDIGCSSGIMTREYANHFKFVTGIDIDHRAIEFEKKTLKKATLNFC